MTGLPDIKSFIDSGAVALLITLLLGGFVAFAKGMVVPKPFYEREVTRGDKLTEIVERHSDALKALTDEVRARGK